MTSIYDMFFRLFIYIILYIIRLLNLYINVELILHVKSCFNLKKFVI